MAHFGKETLDVIENQSERLLEVPGIAKKRIKMIQTAWENQKAIFGSDGFIPVPWSFHYLCREDF